MSRKNTGLRYVAEVGAFLFVIVFFAVNVWAQNLRVYVGTSKGRSLSGLRIYAFTEIGSYTGRQAITDENGTAFFDSNDFDGGSYKFRADYLRYKFWSGVITLPEMTSVEVLIEEETAEVRVIACGMPAEGARVYLFSGSGSYLAHYGNTDGEGKVFFDLPVGRDFKFKADLSGNHYWSDITTILAEGPNQVSLDAGGGILKFTLEKSQGIPMEGIHTYLFNASGAYLGLAQVTDSSGSVSFAVPEGNYKVRADYLGSRFWAQEILVLEDIDISHTIPHRDVDVIIQGAYQEASEALEGLKVYLFSRSGAYLKQYRVTDASGRVTFNLPEQPYKVRADYLGMRFWSSEFTWEDNTVDIPMADAEVRVTGARQPLEGVKVYVFTSAGSYLKIKDNTDSNGQTNFRLAAGSYKFRADYQGNRYWSDAESLTADQVSPIEISTGGGTFELTVKKGSGDPLAGLKCYVFNEGGSYLGMSATTDANGRASFGLGDGGYKIRVDYLGYRLWTSVYEIPSILSDVLNIPHRDVDITVQSVYQDMDEPLDGLKVYLFTPSGSYLKQYQTTDTNGRVTFSLPEQSYKVRADYLGGRYWSGEFMWQETNLDIPHGMARVHVKRGSADVQGAKVYLFTESASYLSRYEVTDAFGNAEFLLAARTFKFRVDEGGDRVWSDPFAITADQVNNVDLNMGAVPPIVSISADPQGISAGEVSILSWTSTDAETVTIDRGIGEVGLTGSTAVTPAATTTYTITATGTGGTATDATTVTVHTSPEDVDYGLDKDEQQGGGGLVGETVRLLNGNALDIRSDLRFSSPHRLGLSFQAVYNSRSNSFVSGLGFGWSHTYGAALFPSFAHSGITYLKIVDGTGRAHYFREGVAGEYIGAFNESSHVKLESGEYVWYRVDGSKYGFDGSGRLFWIEDEKGNRLDVSYGSQGRLEDVTDTASDRSLTFGYDANGRLDSIFGPTTHAVSDGVWVTYAYDANENIVAVNYADGSGVAYSYNDPEDAHNLTEKRNKAGHLLNSWGYNENDLCVDNFSVQGKGVVISYVADNKVDVTDAYGALRSYTLGMVGGRKRVTGMTGIGGAPYSAGNEVRWVYDDEMRLVEVEDAGGTVNRYQDYDDRGNPGRVQLAVGTFEERTITYKYHPEINEPLSRSEASVLGIGNKVTQWDYDNDYNAIPNENPTGLVYRVIEKGFTRDAAENIVPYEYITTFTYNDKGQILSVDGPFPGTEDTTCFSYEPTTGDLLSITRPVIGSTDFSGYDGAGRVGEMTDVNGQSKMFSYDGRGRVTTIKNNADGSSTDITYNTAGRLESVTDEDGITRSFEYDKDYGRLIRIADYEGNYMTYQYDAQGNRIEMSKHDSSGTRTSRKRWNYQHPDMPGKLFKEMQADGTFTEYGYDKSGNINSMTDPNSNITVYLYDFLNRLAEVDQPGDVITSYFYDIYGNLASVLDAEGHEMTYQYDDMGRLVSTTSPDTGTVSYVYDEAGNLLSKTDTNGITVRYTYDTLNRLTAIQFPDSAQDIIYSYDEGVYGKGKRTGMVDSSGSMTFSYDSRGRPTGKTATILGHSYVFGKTFSPGNRLMTVTYPFGRTMDYSRDSMGRMNGLSTTYESNTTTLVSNMAYNPFGSPKGMSTGSGGEVENHSGECDCIEVSNPGEQMERLYEYDNNRNLISITGTNTPWYKQTFSYDALNRLTHAEGRYGICDYAYDKVGNRLTRTINSETENYTYVTGTNKLSEITGTGPITFTYDSNGNVTGIGGKVLIYNQNNRLIKVEEGGDILGEYTYNGLGQRVIKEAEGNTTIYHYDLNGNLIGESSPDGIFLKEYLYMGKIRMAMVDVASDEMYYYLNDRLGTPQIMTDESGEVVWEAFYRPFGEAEVNPASTIVNNIRLPGQYYDQETDLHYNYHRYYDPRTGRYLTPDPIGLEGGINLFVYAENDPVNLIDLFGLQGVALAEGSIYNRESLEKTLSRMCSDRKNEQAFREFIGQLEESEHERGLFIEYTPGLSIRFQGGNCEYIAPGATLISTHVKLIAVAPGLGAAGIIPATVGTVGVVVGGYMILKGLPSVTITYESTRKIYVKE